MPKLNNNFTNILNKLITDKNKYTNMEKALYAIAVPDSAERLCAVMEQLAKKKEKHNADQTKK